MINLALLKYNFKSNYKIMLVFALILTIYVSTIISTYNPRIASSLDSFIESMPELMRAFGMSKISTDLINFLVNYLYGFLLLVIPLVLIIIISNKLVAHHTDIGSMEYLLASPNSRKKIFLTQFLTLITTILIVIIYCTIITIITCSILFPNKLDITSLIILNFNLLLFHIALSSICFFISVFANDSKRFLFYGAGIPFIFFLIQMIVNVSDKLELMKYFTIFTLFDAQNIINSNTIFSINSIILILISTILYFCSFKIFLKKDFPV